MTREKTFFARVAVDSARSPGFNARFMHAAVKVVNRIAKGDDGVVIAFVIFDAYFDLERATIFLVFGVALVV